MWFQVAKKLQEKELDGRNFKLVAHMHKTFMKINQTSAHNILLPNLSKRDLNTIDLTAIFQAATLKKPSHSRFYKKWSSFEVGIEILVNLKTQANGSVTFRVFFFWYRQPSFDREKNDTSQIRKIFFLNLFTQI